MNKNYAYTHEYYNLTKFHQNWTPSIPLLEPFLSPCSKKCVEVKNCSGTIKTTLRMCGMVRLKFGNCHPTVDYVVAKLNGKQVGRANPNQSKTIELAFKDGDILELTEIENGFIALYGLNITSCSTC